jgi:hypothetical protein
MTDRELLELYDYHYPLAPNQLAYLINLFAKAEQEKERVRSCVWRQSRSMA